ncbi:hypothetical protein SAMN04489724_3484 [Algoriphagus locisalis]|uniref:Uncharacterized protein n=1 Tax=Algoriphagus locisalis TaxID=305507 RepID=A0A1I7CVC4_9BACT|nr:hypothetical protein SAMN04489724_3484 [Algoriphagus locisalis]
MPPNGVKPLIPVRRGVTIGVTHGLLGTKLTHDPEGGRTHARSLDSKPPPQTQSASTPLRFYHFA